jgi:chemotaxis protein CheZ
MQAEMYQLLSFHMGEVECAIHLSLVHEVIQSAAVTHLPGCAGALSGVIHRYGKLLPAVDLRQQFAFPACPADERTRLLILDAGGECVALLVDALGEILYLPLPAVQPLPDWMSGLNSRYLQGFITVEGRWLLILDPSRLLEGHTKSLAVQSSSHAALSSEGNHRQPEDATLHPKRAWRDKVLRQSLDTEAQEVKLQSTLNAQALKDLEEMARALSEGDFYRQVSTQVQGELENLATYIGKTMANLQLLEPSVRVSAEFDIPEASQQLSDVVKATEEATNTIISLTETLLDHQTTLGEAIQKLKGQKNRSREYLQVLDEIDHIHQEDEKTLIEVLTSLSFQDLTGQRINKIMYMVSTVQSKLFDLVKAFGIQVEASAKELEAHAPIPKALGGKEERAKLGQDSVDSLLNQDGIAEDHSTSVETAPTPTASPAASGEGTTKLAQDSVDDLLNQLFN